ncbi:hypothetical protein REPUB_Repub03eG0088400 [Reevesia pubescens]
MTVKQRLVIPISAVAGHLGIIIDSLLGATLQLLENMDQLTVKKISGLSILDNNAVNLVSVLPTTPLPSVACVYIF